MSNLARKSEYDGAFSVSFDIEDDEVMAIGEKMESMNPQAYMNGYNWAAFLDYYLRVNHPELTDDLSSDPEAGMYSGYYGTGAEAEAKSDQLAAVINALIAEPDNIYSFLEAEGDNIDWD